MDYTSLITKIKAMKSKLMNKTQLEDLAETGTVEQLSYRLLELKNYSEIIKEIDVKDLRRDIVESRLRLSIFEDYNKIRKFSMNSDTKAYLDGFFLGYEIYILKFLLCLVYDKSNNPSNYDDTNTDSDFFLSPTDLNKLIGKRLHAESALLTESKSVTELILNLEQTKYAGLISTTTNDNQSLFELEIQIDLNYYMKLWDVQQNHLHGKELEQMTALIGMEIDMQNVIWIYRLKKYYKLDDTLIYTKLIPIAYSLKKEDLAILIETKDTESLENAIKEINYFKDLTDIKDIEKHATKQLNKKYRKYRIQNPKSIIPVAEYFRLKDAELRNIITLLEGVRYNVESETILTYLI